MAIWIINDPQQLAHVRDKVRDGVIWTLDPAVLLEAERQSLEAHDLLRLSGIESTDIRQIEDEAHEIGLQLWDTVSFDEIGLPSWAFEATAMAVSNEAKPLLRACLLAGRVRQSMSSSFENVLMCRLPVQPMIRTGPTGYTLPALAAFQSCLAALAPVKQYDVPSAPNQPYIRKITRVPELREQYGVPWRSREDPETMLLTEGMRDSDVLDLLPIAHEDRMLVVSEFRSPAIQRRLGWGGRGPSWQALLEQTARIQRTYQGSHPEIFRNEEFAEQLALYGLEIIHGLEIADSVAAVAAEFKVKRIVMGFDFLIRERLIEERTKQMGVQVISYAHGGLIARNPSRLSEQRCYGEPDRLWVWGQHEFDFVRALRPELAERTDIIEPPRRSTPSVPPPGSHSSGPDLDTVLLLTSPVSLAPDTIPMSRAADIVDLWISLLAMAKGMPDIRFVIRTHAGDNPYFFNSLAESASPNIELQRSGEVSDLEGLRLAVMVQAHTSAALDVARLGVPVVHLTQHVFQCFLEGRPTRLTELSVGSVNELASLISELDDPAEYERRLVATYRLCTSMTWASPDAESTRWMRRELLSTPSGDLRREGGPAQGRLKPLLGVLRGDLRFMTDGGVNDNEVAVLAAARRHSGEGLASLLRVFLRVPRTLLIRLLRIRDSRRELGEAFRRALSRG